MSKKSLQIKIYAEDKQGRIDILGSISEWNKNNAIDFRERCQELKDSGISNVHVYMMTVGGDCFQANEIVNILSEIFGSYTAEGGAVVASAGTYIAVNATKFTMAKNGQFMIHKPMGGTHGNETELKNYLKLLENMTITYFDAYKAVLKKPESEFKEKWDAGDFWMTSNEAKDWGFVNEVKKAVKIDPDTAQAIKDSGSPIAIAKGDITKGSKNKKNMDLKATATALGMDVNSTEEQVNARIAENARKATELGTLKAQQKLKEKEEQASKIKAELDKAIKEKRISADSRAKWETQLEKDFVGTKALLDGVQAIVKPLSSIVKPSVTGKGATYEGKTWEELQDESPELLAELEDKDPTAFNALFADWKKRNRI